MIRLRRYTTDCAGVRVYRWYTVARWLPPLTAIALIGCSGFVLGSVLPLLVTPPAPPARAAELLPRSARVLSWPAAEIVPTLRGGQVFGQREPVPVPEPATWLLVATAILVLLAARLMRSGPRADREIRPAHGVLFGGVLALAMWLAAIWLIWRW